MANTKNNTKSEVPLVILFNLYQTSGQLQQLFKAANRIDLAAKVGMITLDFLMDDLSTLTFSEQNQKAYEAVQAEVLETMHVLQDTVDDYNKKKAEEGWADVVDDKSDKLS